jgi:hypothetical protein
MALRIHAICVALNEEIFIGELLKMLYPFCSGISILSQYDRDWTGRTLVPDRTADIVLNFPDPQGKIQFIVRRWRDQTAARNSEMLAITSEPAKKIQSQVTPIEDIRAFHAAPDYFLIVDADEIYDVDTFRDVLDYLDVKRPRGMRVLGYNYVRTWNRRVPSEVVHFSQFGFLRPGILFEYVRVVNWNESRLSKVLKKLLLPDISSRLFGFVNCPVEIGYFHHGCWLGDDARLMNKFARAGHRFDAWAIKTIEQIDALQTVYIPTRDLPKNIRDGNWPETFFEDEDAVANTVI